MAKRGRPMNPDGQKKQYSTRLPDSLIKEIEDFIDRFKEETGIEITFSEAMRALIEDGIKTRKSKHTRRKSSTRKD